MKGYLKKLIKRKKEEMQKLQKRSNDSTDINEVRSIGETLATLREEIEEAESKLEELEAQGEGDNSTGEDGTGEEGRSALQGEAQTRNATVLGAFSMRNGNANQQTETDPFATMEYRQAFKNYAQRGVAIPEDIVTRAGGETGTTTAAEIGAIIPTTVMNELVKELSKVRGNIYSKVRKLNVKGGVKFPISNLQATFKWITETTPSERQKAGDVKEYIEFSYNLGEIRVSTSLLASIVSLDLFEAEVKNLIMEAFLEAMDKGIISGTGNGQLTGITKDKRVKNSITMTEAEISDWEQWRKKLFARIPLSKRGKGEFLFPASTVEGYLMTMKDTTNRPLWKDPDYAMSENGTTAGKFFGRNTEYVEPDVISDFDTAADGDVIGIYWVPTDYAINTNMQFGIKRYFDEDKNEWVDKGLVIVDGKILDTSGVYLIKKKVSA